MIKLFNLFLSCASVLTLSLVSCGDSKPIITKNLQGCWLEQTYVNDSTLEYSGMFLEADSIASSISRPLVKLSSWELIKPQDVLVLRGYEIKYGRRIDYCDSMDVVMLSDDSLKLFSKSKALTFTYHKVKRADLENIIGQNLNPLDSLPLNPNYGSLLQRTYQGVLELVKANSGDGCNKNSVQLTLWNQNNVGDGVYRLRYQCEDSLAHSEHSPASESIMSEPIYSFGRFYTLTHLIDNTDDRVLNLISFDNNYSINFLIISPDSLELINNDYTFNEENNFKFLLLDGSFSMNENLLIAE